MKTFKQFQEEKKFGPDGKPISKKDDLLKRMSKGYDKNVKGQLKDLESKARKPTQSPDGSYEVKFKKDGTPYTNPSAPDAKTGSDRIDNKTGSNMRKTKGQTYTKAPKTNTKSKTYGSNKNYRNRTQSEINRDFNKGIDDPSLKQSRTNIKSKTVGKNIKDILKNAFGNKNKVKNPIQKIGKPATTIPKTPTVFSKVANVAKNLGPKGKIIALGALAGGVAYANRDKIGNLFNRIVGKTPVYTGGYGKGNKGLPPGSEGKPTHKMKQMYIKGIPKARVDKRGSAQVSKPKKGSWNDRQLKMTKEEVAIANSMSGGGIAGSVEAGHEPPVNKKKKKGEPTIIARGCMPGARGRFKGGVELLASLKKNKYT